MNSYRGGNRDRYSDQDCSRSEAKVAAEGLCVALESDCRIDRDDREKRGVEL